MVMPCYRLGKAARLNLSNIWIPLLTIMAVVVFRITPIYIIVLVGAAPTCTAALSSLRKRQGLRRMQPRLQPSEILKP